MLTRRDALKLGGLAAAGLAAGLPDHLTQALVAAPACGSLKQIEHVVSSDTFDHTSILRFWSAASAPRSPT